ncbi:MAG: acyltransferase [Micrococcales bacterium]|nr:acyltransferase [Micrococcales bacterium]
MSGVDQATTRNRSQPPELAGIETTTTKRLDIEGLRALAIVLVVVYHAVNSWLPGGFTGVDVFFVISGFLITGQIWREVATTGRIRLARFWSRRAKRLLPATMVVLLFCSAVTLSALAITQRTTFGGDIVSAALYLVNWRLAGRAVNYAAEGTGLSPVQHFWSLAVEEQFYILWPLLVSLVVLIVAHQVGRRRIALIVAISLVVIVSLAWSIQLTSSNQPMAFFVTQTRLWELGLGALGALALPLVARLKATIRAVMAASGVGLVALTAVVARENVAWPGYQALLPCLGTLAIILAGSYPPDSGLRPHPVARVLAIRPMAWLGALSYSWYLWHWPALIWARALWPNQTGPVYLAVAVASLLPAYLTHRFVENPIRYGPIFTRRPMVALAVGGLCTAIGASAGLVVYQFNHWTRPVAQRSADPVIEGQASPSAGQPTLGATPSGVAPRDWQAISAISSYPVIRPDPLEAQDDLPESYTSGCRQEYDHAEPGPCLAGDQEADTTIAVVGDSYIEQWEPALDLAAKGLGLRVLGYYKTGCPLSVAAIDARQTQVEAYATCPVWARAVVRELIDLKPAFVLVSQRLSEALSDPSDPASPLSQTAMAEGVTELWRQLEAAGIPIVVFGRNPDGALAYDTVYECVAQRVDSLGDCAFEPDTSTARWQKELVAEFGPGASYFDLNDWICSPTLCPAVIDGLLVYRGTTHLTATFAASLAPVLELELAKHL